MDRVFASVPESTVVDVYKSVSSITDSGVPAFLKSLVNGADAEKAYAGFCISAFDSCYHGRVSAIAGLAAAAPRRLVTASRRRLIEAMAGIFRHQVPSSLVALMIIDKTIVMGAQADPELLKARTTPTTRP